MIYDLILLGSGPANLFAAMELTRTTDLKILILERARRLNDSRNISLGWLGGSARAAVNLFLKPGFGGEIEDEEVIARFVERLEEYTNNTFKPSKPRLLKRTLKMLEDADVEVDEPETISLTEDKMIKLGDLFYKELKLSTTIMHKMEISRVSKKDELFVVETSDGIYQGKKCVMGLGRAGPQWLKEIDFDLAPKFEESNFELGLRMEFPVQSMKEVLSKSHHFQLKFGEYKTTIPTVNGVVETVELGRVKVSNGRTINSHRGHYANFGLLKKFYDTNSEERLLRLVEIANVLCDDQILREPISKILNGTSVISPIEEYDSMKEGIKKILEIFPNLKKRCVIYAPEARLNTLRYDLTKGWESTTKGLYIIGDMSGRTKSFVQAACSGLLAAESIKEASNGK